MAPLVWLLLGLGLWIVVSVPVALVTGQVLRGLDDDQVDVARREPVGARGRR